MNFNSDLFLEHLKEDFTRCQSTDPYKHYKMHTLASTILKKFVGSTSSMLHDAAMADFVSLNTHVSEYRVSNAFASSSVFRTWKAILADVFHSEGLQICSLNLHRCIDVGRCGPGTSLGADSTSFLEKMFASTLTTTESSLLTFYRQVIGGRWAKAEEIRAQAFGSTIVQGSKLSSVPKDSTKNRTICIEPTLNMFYQLGAKQQIESVLRSRLKIDISTQADVNKLLAKRSSVDGSLATLDLKNASDSISIELCRHLLPAEVFGLLMKIRSPYADVSGVPVKLAMMSTMGNGFTFPLMTLLFATLIKAISVHAGTSCVNGKDFGVFGDDLIVKSELASTLVRCLKQAGFTVNDSKSFFTGFFRESCGGDYFNGHDVRGVYFKELHSVNQLYSAFNRLHFWSLRHDVSLHHTLVYLKGLADFRPVPGHASTHEGFIVTREQLSSPKQDRNGAIYYRSLEPVQSGSLKVGRFETNHHGCLVAFLGGFVSDKRVLCRNRIKPVVVKKKTPCWDYLTHPGVNRRELSLSWQMLLSTA